MSAQMSPDKKCCNCQRGLPIYRKGFVIAWLCRDDIDWIVSGEILADDMSDLKDCKKWKPHDE